MNNNWTSTREKQSGEIHINTFLLYWNKLFHSNMFYTLFTQPKHYFIQIKLV